MNAGFVGHRIDICRALSPGFPVFFPVIWDLRDWRRVRIRLRPPPRSRLNSRDPETREERPRLAAFLVTFSLCPVSGADSGCVSGAGLRARKFRSCRADLSISAACRFSSKARPIGSKKPGTRPGLSSLLAKLQLIPAAEQERADAIAKAENAARASARAAT